MSDNIATRLNNLKDLIDKGKEAKARAEANLETYTKQRDDVVAKMAELGVTPETIEAEIQRLGNEIEKGLKQAEELLVV